jgi:hypothetical protein
MNSELSSIVLSDGTENSFTRITGGLWLQAPISNIAIITKNCWLGLLVFIQVKLIDDVITNLRVLSITVYEHHPFFIRTILASKI